MAKNVFKPGDAKPANSGRKKGTPNKKTVEEQLRYDFIMDIIENRMMEADDVINNLSPARAAELYVNLLGHKKAKLSATRIDGNIRQDTKVEFVIRYDNQLPPATDNNIIDI